jgi:hypothetical protein
MSRRSYWLVTVAAGMFILAGLLAWTQGGENKKSAEGKEERDTRAEAERAVKAAEVPAAALAALRKMSAGAEITAFAEETEQGHTFYEGSWKGPSGTNVDVLVTPTGDLVEIEEEVGADQVPAAVLAAARKAAGKEVKLGLEKKTMVLYEAKFQRGGVSHELLLNPVGTPVEEPGTKAKDRQEKE